MRIFTFVSAATAFFVCICLVTANPIPPETSSAQGIIPGKYIVILNPRASIHNHLSRLSKRSSSTILANDIFSIGDSYQAYTADIALPHDVSYLISNADVLSVEPDRIIKNIDDHHEASKMMDKMETQTPIANWGLGRISHRAPGALEYVYDSSAGQGTYAYVVGTGVYPEHQQFGGRASSPGYSTVSGGSSADDNGDGTAIAGIIAGSRDGVSKQASIIPVKVLDHRGAGSISSVIAGTEWAVRDAQTNGRLNKSVLHFSLGGGYSAALNDAVTAAVNQGLMVIVAAGGSNTDASEFSPGSAPGAFVVGSSTSADGRAYFSNYGPIVRVYAPGVSIQTTWVGNVNATATLRGTTASAAFVSGVALYLMRLFPQLVTPGGVADMILSLSTKAPSGIRILYNGSGM